MVVEKTVETLMAGNDDQEHVQRLLDVEGTFDVAGTLDDTEDTHLLRKLVRKEEVVVDHLIDPVMAKDPE